MAAHGKVERGCEEAIEIYWVTAKVLIFTTDSFFVFVFLRSLRLSVGGHIFIRRTNWTAAKERGVCFQTSLGDLEGP